MRTDLSAFFHDHDRQFLSIPGRKLHEPARCCETSRTTADDNDIKFHGFPLD